MDYDVLKAFTNNEIEPYLQNIEMWQCITALDIKPFKDGNQWSFLYGDNIQEGICGFGDTIDKAAWDFYTNLKSEKLPSYWPKQGEQKDILEDATLDNNEDGLITDTIKARGEQKPDNSIWHEMTENPEGDANDRTLVVFEDGYSTTSNALLHIGFGTSKSYKWAYVNDILRLTLNFKQIEQKPANKVEPNQNWSEESIATISRAISIVKWAAYSDHSHPILNDEGATELIERLNFIKDRVQPKQEWSEEDKYCIHQLIVFCENCMIPDSGAKRCANWLRNRLKSLRPQNWWKAVDKEIYVKEPALAQRKDKSEPNHGYVICYDHTLTPDVYERFIMISDIYNQSHWKPTEEQITVVNDTIRFIKDKSDSLSSDYLYNKMKELLEQLKAL